MFIGSVGQRTSNSKREAIQETTKSSRRANYGRTHVFHQEGDRTPKFKVTTKKPSIKSLPHRTQSRVSNLTMKLRSISNEYFSYLFRSTESTSSGTIISENTTKLLLRRMFLGNFACLGLKFWHTFCRISMKSRGLSKMSTLAKRRPSQLAQSGLNAIFGTWTYKRRQQYHRR